MPRARRPARADPCPAIIASPLSLPNPYHAAQTQPTGNSSRHDTRLGPGVPLNPTARHGNVLLLQWNGSTWTAVPGPTLGTTDRLFAVAASSSSNVWAVGEFSNGGAYQALALHCC